MPDPTPAAPAVAAAPTPAQSTPTPAAAPAPAPTPTPAPKEKTSKKLYDMLVAVPPSLEAQITPKPKEKKPDAAPAPAAKTEPPAAPAAAAPATPAKAAKEIKRRKEEPAAPAADTPPQVPRRQEPAPTPAPAAAPAAHEPSDADFEKSLVEEEQAMLADARAAEKLLGDKYKGQAAKTTAYLKENLKRLQALEKGELNGKPYDESDHKAWAAQAQPKISLLDQRELMRRSAVEQAKTELQPEIARERHERWVATEEPKFQAERETLKSNLRSSAYPDDLLNVAEQRLKGLTPNTPEYNAALTQIRTDYALELEVAEQVIDAATADMAEFKRLTTRNPATGKAIADLAEDAAIYDEKTDRWLPNPNPRTPEGAQHARILSIIAKVDDEFTATGGTALWKNGKFFATRADMAHMENLVRQGKYSQAELAKFWTFTDKEITERALAMVKPAIAKQTEERRKSIERYGFTRQLAQPAAAPAAPVPTTPPGAPAAPRSAPPPAGGGSIQPTTGKRLSSLLVN